MAREFTGVGSDGESWTGSAADFKEDLAGATACGFISGDGYEHEWSATADSVGKTAFGLELAFGTVQWLGRDSGRTIILVVGY